MASMEDMYGRVGKQLNYYSKTQKINNRLSESSEKKKENDERKNMAGTLKIQ